MNDVGEEMLDRRTYLESSLPSRFLHVKSAMSVYERVSTCACVCIRYTSPQALTL